jgi:hypothetical protein
LTSSGTFLLNYSVAGEDALHDEYT